MTKFRADYEALAARLKPLLQGRLLQSFSRSSEQEHAVQVAPLAVPAREARPMYRTLCPLTDCSGYWLMMDQKEHRPYWRMFQPMNVSSVAARTLESYMSGSGTITVYNEPDRTQVVLDPTVVPPRLVELLLWDRVLGPPPYFIRFQMAGTCLWIAETRDELDSHLLQLLTTQGIEVFPAGLQVQEIDPNTASEIELYRDIAQNPMDWLSEGIVFEHDSDTLRYKSVGAAAPVVATLGDEWGRSVIGAPFDFGFEDRSFDIQTSIAYKRVFHTGQPHISQVSGPLMTDDGLFFQNYYRIIVPIPQRPDQVMSVARLAGMAAPFPPSRSDQECA